METLNRKTCTMAHSMYKYLMCNDGRVQENRYVWDVFASIWHAGYNTRQTFKRGRCFRSENTPKSGKEGYHVVRVYL